MSHLCMYVSPMSFWIFLSFKWSHSYWNGLCTCNYDCNYNRNCCCNSILTSHAARQEVDAGHSSRNTAWRVYTHKQTAWHVGLKSTIVTVLGHAAGLKRPLQRKGEMLCSAFGVTDPKPEPEP